MSVVRAICVDTTRRYATRLLQKIGTHDGTFHCDEALAVFLLRQIPKYEKAGKSSSRFYLNTELRTLSELIRTRNADLLNQCTIVVDVGAVYDPQILRFDHHQRGFTEVFGHGFETKLSSAGLIYK
jgi:uncharacterized UPF0160 family protein